MDRRGQPETMAVAAGKFGGEGGGRYFPWAGFQTARAGPTGTLA